MPVFWPNQGYASQNLSKVKEFLTVCELRRGVLTDQPDYDGAKNYWKVLKFRLKAEGNESVTNCNQLKMVTPGRNRW